MADRFQFCLLIFISGHAEASAWVREFNAEGAAHKTLQRWELCIMLTKQLYKNEGVKSSEEGTCGGKGGTEGCMH